MARKKRRRRSPSKYRKKIRHRRLGGKRRKAKKTRRRAPSRRKNFGQRMTRRRKRNKKLGRARRRRIRAARRGHGPACYVCKRRPAHYGVQSPSGRIYRLCFKHRKSGHGRHLTPSDIERMIYEEFRKGTNLPPWQPWSVESELRELAKVQEARGQRERIDRPVSHKNVVAGSISAKPGMTPSAEARAFDAQLARWAATERSRRG